MGNSDIAELWEGQGEGSHTSKLEAYFLMSLTQRMPNFQQKKIIGHHELMNIMKFSEMGDRRNLNFV